MELVQTTAKMFSIRKSEPLVVPVCVLSDLPLLHLLDPLLHLHLVHESRKRDDIRYLLFVTSTIVILILKVLGIKL